MKKMKFGSCRKKARDAFFQDFVNDDMTELSIQLFNQEMGDIQEVNLDVSAQRDLKVMTEIWPIIFASKSTKELYENYVWYLRKRTGIDKIGFFKNTTVSSSKVTILGATPNTELVAGHISLKYYNSFYLSLQAGKAIISNDLKNDPRIHNSSHPDGKTLQFPLFDEHNITSGALIFLRTKNEVDFTEKEAKNYLKYMLLTQELINIEKRGLMSEINQNSNNDMLSFLGNMSHEIKTPLNGIVGMTELINYTKHDPINPDHLQIITTCSVQLLKIINDIIDYSRMHFTEIQLKADIFDLHEIVTQAYSIVQQKYEEKKQEIDITVNDDKTKQLYGDSGRVKQILINLLGNANKFGREKPVKLIVSSFFDSLDDNECRIFIQIHDEGVGIAEENLENIFKPFNQKNRRNELREGTGLGLSIIRRLVELMHGDISIESMIDIGTIITINFYIRYVNCGGKYQSSHCSQSEDAQPSLNLFSRSKSQRINISKYLDTKYGVIPHVCSSSKCLKEHLAKNEIIIVGKLGVNSKQIINSQTQKETVLILPSDDNATNMEWLDAHIGYSDDEEETDTGDIQKYEIIFVDDDQNSLYLFREMLKRINLKINLELVNDSREIEERIKNKLYDLIFIDIRMPAIDGNQVADIIKRTPLSLNKDSILIAVTAGTLNEAGPHFDLVLSKPLSSQAIDKALELLD